MNEGKISYFSDPDFVCRVIIWIFAIAIIATAIFLLPVKIFYISTDGASYLERSASPLQSVGYFRGPVFSIYLYFWSKIAGSEFIGSYWAMRTIWILALLGTFVFASTLYGKIAGLVATSFALSSWYFYTTTTSLSIDLAFIPSGLAGLSLFYYAYSQNHRLSAYISGILIAIACLTKELGFLFATVPFFYWCILPHRRERISVLGPYISIVTLSVVTWWSVILTSGAPLFGIFGGAYRQITRHTENGSELVPSSLQITEIGLGIINYLFGIIRENSVLWMLMILGLVFAIICAGNELINVYRHTSSDDHRDAVIRSRKCPNLFLFLTAASFAPLLFLLSFSPLRDTLAIWFLLILLIAQAKLVVTICQNIGAWLELRATRLNKNLISSILVVISACGLCLILIGTGDKASISFWQKRWGIAKELNISGVLNNKNIAAIKSAMELPQNNNLIVTGQALYRAARFVASNSHSVQRIEMPYFSIIATDPPQVKLDQSPWRSGPANAIWGYLRRDILSGKKNSNIQVMNLRSFHLEYLVKQMGGLNGAIILLDKRNSFLAPIIQKDDRFEQIQHNNFPHPAFRFIADVSNLKKLDCLYIGREVPILLDKYKFGSNEKPSETAGRLAQAFSLNLQVAKSLFLMAPHKQKSILPDARKICLL